VQIAECESGGNPTAVSPSGRYRGKYQFSMGTWREMGGEGDPAEAPEWLQDRIALKLYRRAGSSPWPNCP
jgi:soluble lytic murein transglycosylase-like protein